MHVEMGGQRSASGPNFQGILRLGGATVGEQGGQAPFAHTHTQTGGRRQGGLAGWVQPVMSGSRLVLLFFMYGRYR